MIKQKIAQLKHVIDSQGFEKHDKRFHRHCKGINSYLVDYSELLVDKPTSLPDDKYRDDWQRMYRYFSESLKEVQENQSSRRLILLNTNNYLVNYQCFQLMQFVIRADGNYDAIIYQRSADLLNKVENDIKFFLYICDKFEKKSYGKISTLRVMYGNLHYVVKNGD